MAFSKRIATWIFYLLAFYILLQTIWWGYSLMQLNSMVLELQKKTGDEFISHSTAARQWMILGEGAVFILLLGFGFWRLIRYVRQEFQIARMEKTFLLSVTHEIKTPIAALRLLLETAGKRELDQQQMQSIVGLSLEETEKLQSLTDNVLLATRLDQASTGLVKEQIELCDVVQNVITERNRREVNNERLTQEAGKKNWITGDRQLIHLLVSNLIDNALKYSPADKSVVVKIEAGNEGKIISVEDFGSGIPESEKEKVFQKFFRLQSNDTKAISGTGLGLYLVKNIARLHGGEVLIEDNMPTGTKVKVIFPANNRN